MLQVMSQTHACGRRYTGHDRAACFGRVGEAASCNAGWQLSCKGHASGYSQCIQAESLCPGCQPLLLQQGLLCFVPIINGANSMHRLHLQQAVVPELRVSAASGCTGNAASLATMLAWQAGLWQMRAFTVIGLTELATRVQLSLSVVVSTDVAGGHYMGACFISHCKPKDTTTC